MSPGIEAFLPGLGLPDVSFRLGGADRFEVSGNINRDAFDSPDKVFIATGFAFPDALAGAALAGRENAPLYVVPRTCVPQHIVDDITAFAPEELVLLGGPAALTAAVETLTPCGGAQAPTPAPAPTPTPAPAPTPLPEPAPTPATETQLVSDTFDRASTDGWGSARIGGAYALAASRSFSTNGEEGVVSIPAPATSRTATLSDVSTRDVRAAQSIALPTLPARGNGVSTGTRLRVSGGSHYHATVRVDPRGAAHLSIARINGSTANQTVLYGESLVVDRLAAGQRIRLEFEATGISPVTLRARAWTEDDRIPDWQAVVSDSAADRLWAAGAIAVSSYVSSSTPGLTVTVDDVSAVDLTPGVAGTVPAPVPAPAPTPAPVPAPAPGTVPEPVAVGLGIDTSGTRHARGSAAVGTTRYAVPADARFVSPGGSDRGTGTQSLPFRTVARAIAAAPTGATLVLRGGEYHETIVIPNNKRLTIQSYPGEAVWFDGSSPVTGWKRSGTTWVSGTWTRQFDASPTYTFGAPDGTTPAWSFVNAKHPMASHPDQIWIDGVAQSQVRSLANVTSGTFFADYAGQRLHLGSDPGGKAVRASALDRAISIRGEGSVLRGVGIRNYAPSVPHMGAVTAEKNGITIENIVILDSATTGLHVSGTNAQIRNVTVARSGMLGMSATYADGLRVTRVLSAHNNTEHFNTSPVSGGMKIGRTRDVRVTDSAFVRNHGPGLWLDESVYDGTVVGNDMLNNAGHGVSIEISSKVLVADNLIANSGGNGMKINDAGSIDIWNNTVSGSNRNINIVQDTRRASDLTTPGHDPRQKLPDPTVTWLIDAVNVHNNVLAGSTGNCLLCIEDYSHERSAEQMGVTANGNVYHRASAASPNWMFVWSRGPGNPSVHTTIEKFRSATGQEAQSAALTGTRVFADGWALAPAVAASAPTVARPLPAHIATLVGQSPGERQLGSWLY